MLNVFYSTLFLTFNVLTFSVYNLNYSIIDLRIIINMSFLLILNYFPKCYTVDAIYQDDYSPLAKKSQFPLALEYMLIKFNGAKIKSVRSLPISDRICRRCKGITRVEWRGRVPLLRYQETMQTFASQGFSFRSIAINGTEWTKNLG